MYKVSAYAGVSIPTIQMMLKEEERILAIITLVPHSIQLYEIHLSPVDRSLRGKMIEISKEGLRFLFNDLTRVEKLMATIPVHNRLAIRLAKQVMKYEGTLTKSFYWNGQMEDQDIYGITREEVKCL